MVSRSFPRRTVRKHRDPLPRDAIRALVVTNLVLFALLLLHDLDHVARQQEPTGGPGGVPLYGWTVSLIGYAGLLFAAWLAGRGDRRAPLATLTLGAGFVAGFVLAHALPFGPASYWAYEPGALSWALIVAPIAAGLAAAAVALRATRRTR
jgi:hypothetical protein